MNFGNAIRQLVDAINKKFSRENVGQVANLPHN
jgi:hypothetical protein